MPNTITFTEFDDAIAIAEINALFQDIATVLNGKLDRTSGTLSTDLNAGGQPIINLPYATEDDELVPLKQFIELGGSV